MPVRSVELSPYAGPFPSRVGDIHFAETTGTANVASQFQEIRGASPVTTALTLFDTPLPHGAKILRAKLSVSGFDTRATAASAKLRLPAQDGKWDNLVEGPRFNAHQGREAFSDIADPSGVPLGGISPFGSVFAFFQWEFGQRTVMHSFPITAPGELGSATVRLWRFNSDREFEWVSLEIWSATGAPGAYLPGEQVAVSRIVGYNDVSDALFGADHTFVFQGPNRIQMAPGEVYFWAVRHSGQDYGPGIIDNILLGLLAAGTGNPHNWATDRGSFGLGPSYYGSAVKGNPAFDLAHPGMSGIDFVFPSQSAGVDVSLGDSSYAPNVSIALGAEIQKAVMRPEWNGRLLLGLRGGPLAGQGVRRWRSQNHTIGPGMRIRIEYEAPATIRGQVVAQGRLRSRGILNRGKMMGRIDARPKLRGRL